MAHTLLYSYSYSSCRLLLLKCHQSHKFPLYFPYSIRTCPRAKLNQRVVVISLCDFLSTCWMLPGQLFFCFPNSLSLSLRFPHCKHFTSSSAFLGLLNRLLGSRQPTLRMRVIARKVLYATHLCTFICICLALKFYEVEKGENKEKQTLSKFHGYLNVSPLPLPLTLCLSCWLSTLHILA